MYSFGVNTTFTMPGTAVVGGTPPISPDSYPYFKGEPLPYFACFTTEDNVNGMVFLDDSVDGSWAPEDSANAVLLEGGPVPSWITLAPLDDEPLTVIEEEVEVDFTEDPSWLQGDESPEGSGFLFEVPSNLSPELNIGDGYGTVYVFADDSLNGFMVWQS